jgi:hypothetical protein
MENSLCLSTRFLPGLPTRTVVKSINQHKLTVGLWKAKPENGSPDRTVGVYPSIAHFSGLRRPEIHSPRMGYGGVGITLFFL